MSLVVGISNARKLNWSGGAVLRCLMLLLDFGAQLDSWPDGGDPQWAWRELPPYTTRLAF